MAAVVEAAVMKRGEVEAIELEMAVVSAEVAVTIHVMLCVTSSGFFLFKLQQSNCKRGCFCPVIGLPIGRSMVSF